MEQYIERSVALSFVGAILATLGLIFGIVIGYLTLDFLGISESIVQKSTESTIQSGIIQLVALMMAAAVFTFINSLLRQATNRDSSLGFNHSIPKAVIETVKAVIFVAAPLAIGVIFFTVVVSNYMYVEGNITQGLRDTTIISTMSVFPMVMFYQVGVEKLTM